LIPRHATANQHGDHQRDILYLKNGRQQKGDEQNQPHNASDEFARHVVSPLPLQAKVVSSHRAVRSSRASSPTRPTNCTPTGKPLPADSNGKLIAGMPQNVHRVQNCGFPVDARPRGAAPCTDGVRIASKRSNTSSSPSVTTSIRAAALRYSTNVVACPRSICSRKLADIFSRPLS